MECRLPSRLVDKELERLQDELVRLQAQDDKLVADIEELANALDYHTVENRDKRKAIQEKRDQLKEVRKIMERNMVAGQRALQELRRSIESNLALVKHAENWEWKELETKS